VTTTAERSDTETTTTEIEKGKRIVRIDCSPGGLWRRVMADTTERKKNAPGIPAKTRDGNVEETSAAVPCTRRARGRCPCRRLWRSDSLLCTGEEVEDLGVVPGVAAELEDQGLHDGNGVADERVHGEHTARRQTW
jgi:hypothetical protein